MVSEGGEYGSKSSRTGQKDPIRKGTRPPLTTDREGFREDGEGDLDGLERRIGLWGERGVLRVGWCRRGVSMVPKV